MAKVIIVGGGCAGLSAAYNLKKQGVEFELFESTGEVGGRCRTIVEDGYEFFAGAMATEPQWETTFEYIKDFGLEDNVYSMRKQKYSFLINGKIRTVYIGGGAWETLKNLPKNIVFFFTGFPVKTYIHILRAMRAIRKYIKKVDTETHDFSALAEVSNMSTEEFLFKHKAPLANEWMFSPFMNTMVLERTSHISIAHPIALFALMKGMRSIHGGLGLINEKLYNCVKDNVHLNTPVKKVVIEDGKVTGVETANGFVESDKVICAVDAVLARQLIPDLPDSMRKPLETCKYSSTYYFHFGMEKALDDYPLHCISFPASNKGFLNALTIGKQHPTHPTHYGSTKGWKDEELKNLTEEERERRIIEEIRKFRPDFPEKPKASRIFRWDRAVNIESPGQFIAINNLKKNHMRDVDGLYLAGEYLFLIACTEGAWATGKDAAKLVTEDLRIE